MTAQKQDADKGRIKQFWIAWRGWVLLVLFLLVVVAVLVVLGLAGVIETGFGEYSPPTPATERAKTLWDWMELLLVPLVLAVAAAGFTWVMDRRQREAEERRAKTDRKIELDRARETALTAYLDRMAGLMLAENLSLSEPDSVRRTVARAWTLAVLEPLNGARKGLLLRFLYESDLIGKESIIELSGANLTWADLSGTNLAGANLSQTYLRRASLVRADLRNAQLHGSDLRGANLESADLGGADLHGANLHVYEYPRGSNSDSASSGEPTRTNLRNARLVKADLRNTDLRWANLRGASLDGSDLTGANLRDADLKGATVSEPQLSQAASLKGTTLPDGTVHE